MNDEWLFDGKNINMNTQKFYLLIGIVLAAGLLPQKNAFADGRSTPKMTFEFVQEVPGSKLTMASWSLYNCQDNNCSETGKIIGFGNAFSCSENNCAANVFYDTPFDYFQMKITFSDGITRKSNVFTRRFFDARYRVTIQGASLLVKELKGNSVNQHLPVIVFGSMLYFPIILAVMIIVAFGLAIYPEVKKEGSKVFSKRMGKLLWWTLVFTFILLGTLLSAGTFVATMAIELSVAWIILKYLKTSVQKILYGVFIAKVSTQPLFVIASTTVFTSFINALFLEIIIWLVEGWIVNKAQNNQLPRKNIFIPTFILNAASFGFGILLPI